MSTTDPAALSVLWIEDDDGVAHAFTRLLGQHGAQVTRVADIGEARDALLSRRHFDAILLDLNLPSSQGLETVRRFRAISSLPIVVLTGLVDTKDDSMAQAAALEGAQDWLGKASVADTGPALVRAIRMAVARDKFAKARRRS